ncbi:MAG: hydroxymethylbilane synthase [Deltaproteobacteria bacterium]|nr:hydroxymethylbilane synthase [Deltaproteobacteria bacterium]
MMKKKITIATRGSMLALWQANHIKDSIEEAHPGTAVELLKIKTTGDKILDVPLAMVGGKGLFVKEIEEALIDGRADLAVHSLKDVPTELPEGLGLAAITEREDSRDALISNGKKTLAELPEGAKIGSSSLRRQCQLLKVRPDLNIVSLRGNLDTRIKKVEAGEFDAIILAAAGMRRLGWEERITECISPDILLPAIAQGALGIETRNDDGQTNEIISFLNHSETAAAVKAERALLKRLEGGCQVPIAAYGELEDEQLRLRGLVGSLDGKTLITDELRGRVAEPESLGIDLAENLLDRGAGEILEEIYKMDLGK